MEPRLGRKATQLGYKIGDTTGFLGYGGTTVMHGYCLFLCAEENNDEIRALVHGDHDQQTPHGFSVTNM